MIPWWQVNKDRGAEKTSKYFTYRYGRRGRYFLGTENAQVENADANDRENSYANFDALEPLLVDSFGN